MEYFFIILFECIGISLNVIQILRRIDARSEDDTMDDVIRIFWRQDRLTVLLSAVILTLNLAVHLFFDVYHFAFTEHEYYPIAYAAIALLLGYAGQRWIYRWLGKAEKFINKRIDEKLK